MFSRYPDTVNVFFWLSCSAPRHFWQMSRESVLTWLLLIYFGSLGISLKQVQGCECLQVPVKAFKIKQEWESPDHVRLTWGAGNVNPAWLHRGWDQRHRGFPGGGRGLRGHPFPGGGSPLYLDAPGWPHEAPRQPGERERGRGRERALSHGCHRLQNSASLSHLLLRSPNTFSHLVRLQANRFLSAQIKVCYTETNRPRLDVCDYTLIY